jgi:hypothetical protein
VIKLITQPGPFMNIGGVASFVRFGNRFCRPEKRGCGSPSSERGAPPFRTARLVFGLRRVLPDVDRPAPHRFRSERTTHFQYS